MKEDEFQEEVKNIIFENFEVDDWFDIPRSIPYIESNYEWYNGDGDHCPNGLPWSWEERVIDATDMWYEERGCLIEQGTVKVLMSRDGLSRSEAVIEARRGY